MSVKETIKKFSEHIISKDVVTGFSDTQAKMQLRVKPDFTVVKFKECMEEIGFKLFDNLSFPHCFEEGVDSFGMVVEKKGIYYNCFYELQNNAITIDLHEF